MSMKLVPYFTHALSKLSLMETLSMCSTYSIYTVTGFADFVIVIHYVVNLEKVFLYFPLETDRQMLSNMCKVEKLSNT